MLKDVIVPKRVHKLVVRYSRMSNGATSPRRSRARRVTQQQQQATGGAAPRRIEEIELTVTREKETGKLGFSIDAMNMVVEVEPALASKLKVGDKVIKVDDELLNYKKFVDVVKNLPEHKLRVARLATAAASGPSQNKKEKVFGIGKKARRASKADAPPPSAQAAPPVQRGVGNAMPALREVRLVKEAEDTKIGAVFHRSDDAFDKSFFNVEGSSVQVTRRGPAASRAPPSPPAAPPPLTTPSPPPPAADHQEGGPGLDGGGRGARAGRRRALGQRHLRPLQLPGRRDAAQGARRLQPRRHLGAPGPAAAHSRGAAAPRLRAARGGEAAADTRGGVAWEGAGVRGHVVRGHVSLI
jgi:hypothetical protein